MSIISKIEGNFDRLAEIGIKVGQPIILCGKNIVKINGVKYWLKLNGVVKIWLNSGEIL